MKSNHKILLLIFAFSCFSFSCFAQNYKVIGSFKGKKSKLMSFSYDEKEGKISGYNLYRDKKCEVFMKEGGRVEDYNKKEKTQKTSQDYELISRAFFTKNGKFEKSLFLFKNKNKENLFFFSDTITYQSENAWAINIFEYPELNSKLSKKKIRANLNAISDSLVVLAVTNSEDEYKTMYTFIVDVKKKKIIDHFEIGLEKSSQRFSTLYSFIYSNGYLLYKSYSHESLSKEERKERDMSKKSTIEIGRISTSYFVRNLEAKSQTEYTVDQNDYFVGSINCQLLKDGSIKLTGLYSENPQISQTTMQMALSGSYMTNLTNKVEGIFEQTFKDGKKVEDTKIKFGKDIMKTIKPFKEMAFAGLNWVAEGDRSLFVVTVFPAYTPIFQGTHVVVGICVDKEKNIIWTESVQINAGDFSQFLMFDIYEGIDMNNRNNTPYIDTITGKKKITAYKITCGEIYKKSYKIPTQVEGYNFHTLARSVNDKNNVYALYNKKKQFILVKLKTSKLIKNVVGQ